MEHDSAPEQAVKRPVRPWRSPRERIPEGVLIDEHGCWRWQRFIAANGYGRIGIAKGINRYVHRVAYETFVGPIPSGLQIDHLCRVRDCCNPDHLEAVTPRTNVLRGEGTSARNAVATHCPAGHPYDEANTFPDLRGTRGCRECRRQADLRKAQRQPRLGAVPVRDRQPAGRVVKTHCLTGHPLTAENVYIDPRGRRQCRPCRRDAHQRWRSAAA